MQTTVQAVAWVLFFAFLFVIMIILPARSQKKREQEMMDKANALQKGDQVIIPGGIVGTVAGFKDNAIDVKIAENVKLTVLKTAIVGFVNQSAANEGGAK